MKKEWTLFKLCFKHGLQKKMMTGLSVAFILFGVFFELTQFFSIRESLENATGVFTAEFDFKLTEMYFALEAMYIGQIVISMDVSKLVQSSPYKKKIQTDLPALSMTIVNLAMTTLLLLIRIAECLMVGFTETSDILLKSILVMGIWGFFVMSYSGIVYKYYAASIVLFLVTVFPIILWGGPVLMNSLKLLNGWACVAISYMLIIMGYFTTKLLSRAVYKKEIEGLVFRNALSKLDR